MTTADRARTLANYCQTAATERYLGYFATVDLMQWLQHELGNAEILDDFQQVTDEVLSKAVANSPILHILSGNTPHAGLQSLLRGLLIGAENWVKLPSSGLPVVEKWIAGLPEELSALVSLVEDVDTSLAKAKVVIAIGSDETMESIQRKISPDQRFLPHGHKLSIGVIEKPSAEAAKLAARDICSHNQQGCLSLHTIYVREGAKAFLPLLAEAMASFEVQQPRGEISLSESGAIANLRATVSYEAANDPKNYALMHSEGNTHWTAIYKNTPLLTPSPLNRVAYVQPWPEDWEMLGNEKNFISSVATELKTDTLVELEKLDIPRICALGRSQQPSLFWHHDGFAPLSSLVRWRDIEQPQ